LKNIGAKEEKNDEEEKERERGKFQPQENGKFS
jgi:hypothetical protein